MTIAFSCPGCRKKIEVPGELAGRKAKCKGCGGPLLIPTPRAAPQAASRRREEPEDPYELGEAETLDEPTDLYADDLEDLPAAPSAPRGFKPVKKSKGAARRRPEGPGPVDVALRIVLGALGVAGVLLCLLMVEGMTTTVLRFGLAPFSRRGAYLAFAIVVITLYGGIVWSARMLAVFLPRSSEDDLKNGVATAVFVLAVAVAGLRIARGPEPPTILATLLNWDVGAQQAPAHRPQD